MEGATPFVSFVPMTILVFAEFLSLQSLCIKLVVVNAGNHGGAGYSLSCHVMILVLQPELLLLGVSRRIAMTLRVVCLVLARIQLIA
jgi:hypothetical protein